MYRLNKNLIQKRSFKDCDDDRNYWLAQSFAERLKAAWYLSCMANGLDPNKPHKLDCTVCIKKKRDG